MTIFGFRVDKATATRVELTRSPRLYLCVLQAGIIVACAIGVFALLKMSMKPGIQLWASHLSTILFTATVVAVISVWTLHKQRGLHLRIAATEERYRLLFERSLSGAYRTTLDGRVLDCNVSFCQMLGYFSREDTVGKLINVRCVNPADWVQFLAELRTAKQLTNLEQQLRRTDGKVITVLNSAALVEDDDGSEPFVRGTLTEITELRRAEQEQRRLAAIVRCSDDAIFSLKLDGMIETWNTGAERIFGYGAGEMVGRSVSILAPTERRTEYVQILEGVRDGREVRVETIRVRKDGAHIDVALSVSPVTDAGGQVIGAASIVRDITDQKTAEKTLRKSEIQYRLLFDRNPVPMWVFDRSTLRFLAVNKAAIRQYGYSEQEFLDLTIMDIRPENDIPGLLMNLEKRYHGLQRPESWKHRRKDGAIIDVEIVGHDLDFEGNDAELIAAFDVTEQKNAQRAAREAETKYRGIFENAVLGIFRGASDGRPTEVNLALAKMHGYDSPEEMLKEVSNAAQQLFVDPDRIIELGRLAMDEGVVRAAELEVYRKDRSRFWTRVNLRTVRDGSGGIVNIEGTVEDITDRKAAEVRALYFAYYDALTDLPNRTLLKDRLEMAVAGARRRGDEVALLFLDLDRFTIINDSLGHSFGDQTLKEVAQRLKKVAREQDTVARIGSDEFVILLNGVHDVAEAGAIANRFIESVAQPFEVQDRTVGTSCSVGICVFPQHGSDAESLIHNAEAAMHCAKEDGRSILRFFSEEMNGKASQELALENALRRALPRNELFLVYQPQLELVSGKITGMEALIRWRHPDFGLVLPNQFIPIAEKNGLVFSIGEWVLRTACAQIRQWQAEGISVVPVAVNVSAVQFRNDSFSVLVKKVLRETGVCPELLELELTESLLLANAKQITSILSEFIGMWVKLAIDDFGTGYSSLSYLKQFKVSKLKIDRSFVKDLPTDGDDVAITAAIISMAKSLNLAVIAEGVETEEQMSFLREHQCDEIQGYYFSKPVTAQEMAEKLDLSSIKCTPVYSR